MTGGTSTPDTSGRLPRLFSRWDVVGGLRMHARSAVRQEHAGQLPIVLVHGLGMSSRYMTPAGRHLAPYFDVYLPDLPGFGRSDRPHKALDVPGMADALLAWMDVVGLRQAVLLGNSLGCQVIADFAVRHPSRISQAVFVGPTADPTARNEFLQIGRAAVDAFREPIPLLLIAVYDYLRSGIIRWSRTLHYLVADPLERKLPHVAVPTLVVRGGRDPIVPQRWAERMVECLPNARLVVLDDAAHAAHYSAPAAVAHATRQFLAEFNGAEAGWPNAGPNTR